MLMPNSWRRVGRVFMAQKPLPVAQLQYLQLVEEGPVKFTPGSKLWEAVDGGLEQLKGCSWRLPELLQSFKHAAEAVQKFNDAGDVSEEIAALQVQAQIHQLACAANHAGDESVEQASADETAPQLQDDPQAAAAAAAAVADAGEGGDETVKFLLQARDGPWAKPSRVSSWRPSAQPEAPKQILQPFNQPRLPLKAEIGSLKTTSSQQRESSRAADRVLDLRKQEWRAEEEPEAKLHRNISRQRAVVTYFQHLEVEALVAEALFSFVLRSEEEAYRSWASGLRL
ncbi:hypothetical protein WJX74_003133 [Apatococcus lobatus]|uniref:Uncharacterized protein n=1 Tax=Apatococcus lobatus TaxID=904363 RepID=A0AAW1SBU6_9CHLO